MDFNKPITTRSNVCQTFLRAVGLDDTTTLANTPMKLDTSTIPSSDIQTTPTSPLQLQPAFDTQPLSTNLVDRDLSQLPFQTFEPDELHELNEEELRKRYYDMITERKSFQSIIYKAANTEANETITRRTRKTYQGAQLHAQLQR